MYRKSTNDLDDTASDTAAGTSARKTYVRPTLLYISYVDSEGGKGQVSPTEITPFNISPS